MKTKHLVIDLKIKFHLRLQNTNIFRTFPCTQQLIQANKSQLHTVWQHLISKTKVVRAYMSFRTQLLGARFLLKPRRCRRRRSPVHNDVSHNDVTRDATYYVT